MPIPMILNHSPGCGRFADKFAWVSERYRHLHPVPSLSQCQRYYARHDSTKPLKRFFLVNRNSYLAEIAKTELEFPEITIILFIFITNCIFVSYLLHHSMFIICSLINAACEYTCSNSDARASKQLLTAHAQQRLIANFRSTARAQSNLHYVTSSLNYDVISRSPLIGRSHVASTSIKFVISALKQPGPLY